MATLTYTLPTRAYNSDGTLDGTLLWDNVNNVLDAAGGYTAAPFFCTGGETQIVRRVSPVKAGVIIEATNKAADETIGALAYQVYGGTSDLWSQTWTPAEINDKDFGFAIAYGKNVGGVKTTQSVYLIVSGFNFNLPSDAVINGIQVRLYHASEASGGGTTQARLYDVVVQITYTWAPTVKANGKAGGGVFMIGQINPPDSKKGTPTPCL